MLPNSLLRIKEAFLDAYHVFLIKKSDGGLEVDVPVRMKRAATQELESCIPACLLGLLMCLGTGNLQESGLI